MHKELSYLSPEGYTVFTSQFLKNRGTCCKSACLHCPFGYTLKKCGLEFSDAKAEDRDAVTSLIQDSGQAPVALDAFFPDNVKFIKIKGAVCGVLLKNHIVIKHLYLLPHFQNQDLSKEMVESYLFI
jgi:hypothetical protein